MIRTQTHLMLKLRRSQLQDVIQSHARVSAVRLEQELLKLIIQKDF